MRQYVAYGKNGGKTGGGHFRDPQRDIWNMTDILGCGKEFARPFAIQARRQSKVSAARGQNAKGHVSKIALATQPVM